MFAKLALNAVPTSARMRERASCLPGCGGDSVAHDACRRVVRKAAARESVRARPIWPTVPAMANTLLLPEAILDDCGLLLGATVVSSSSAARHKPRAHEPVTRFKYAELEAGQVADVVPRLQVEGAIPPSGSG